MTTYNIPLEGYQVYVPLDMYAIGLRIDQLGDTSEYQVTQIRKIAGEKVGEARNALRLPFIDVSTINDSPALSIHKGVSDSEKFLYFRLVRKKGGFTALPSAFDLLLALAK